MAEGESGLPERRGRKSYAEEQPKNKAAYDGLYVLAQSSGFAGTLF